MLFDTEQYTGASTEEEKERETFKTHVILFRQLPVSCY